MCLLQKKIKKNATGEKDGILEKWQNQAMFLILLLAKHSEQP